MQSEHIELLTNAILIHSNEDPPSTLSFSNAKEHDNGIQIKSADKIQFTCFRFRKEAALDLGRQKNIAFGYKDE